MLTVFPGRRSPILIKALARRSVLAGCSVLALSGLFLMRHQAAFQRQFELRAESLAKSLAEQAQFALLTGNRQEVERLARSAMAESADSMYVIAEDAAGRFVGGAEQPALAHRKLPPGPAQTGLPIVRGIRVAGSGSLCVEAVAPVAVRNEGGLFGLSSSQAQILGRIRVAMSLESQQALFRSTLRYVFVIAGIVLLAGFVVDYLQIRRLLCPIVDLAQVATQVGNAGAAASRRALKRGDDEIGVLVDRFNEMLDQIAQRTRELHEQVDAKEQARAELAEAQQRLMELSRQSGMAEVATSVLHNVGNVLNSVNVSATIVADRVKASRADKLAALVAMMQQHESDLDAYLTDDPKGQRVLPYLAKLSHHFQEERTVLLDELALINKHIEHIKRIVATQQDYARVSGVIEKVSLSDLVDDALRIVAPGAERHHLTMLRDFEEAPAIQSDKHQILQIVLNLLRNARQAIEESGRPEKLIRVSIRRQGEDKLRLRVQDSGVGLANENLTRIFSHGFTTKANGHGFGLHSGALAARGLGGSLWAESEGLGKGATFILELPLAVATSTGSLA